MQKFKIEFYKESLDTACVALQQSIQALPLDRLQLKNRSIAVQLYKKLKKKQLERLGKEEKPFKVSLEVYEAIVMDELLRPDIYNDTSLYQQAQIRNIIDTIHQLTA